MEGIDASPDEYLVSLDTEIRATMSTLDTMIVEALAGRSRPLWTGVFWGGTEQTIVGYGDITQPRPNGVQVEWFAVGLARQKRNYSLYVNAVEDGRYLGQHYATRLGKVKLGAASIGYTRLENVELDVLRELVNHTNRITQ